QSAGCSLARLRLQLLKLAHGNEAMKNPTHILVVDDDESITDLLCAYLTGFGFHTCTASNGAQMHVQLAERRIDLVLLDLTSPSVDGLKLLRAVRVNSRVPIIMLSARSHLVDRVLGLEMGADDYLCKPFEPRELVARIRTVLRRVPSAVSVEAAEANIVRFDGWELLRHERRLTSPAGQVVPLSNAEFQLLSTFLNAPRRIFSRDQLMSLARGRAMTALDRSIDLLVSRLRKSSWIKRARTG
ncbi:response regulator, partial [Roseateles sp. GG27B]